MIFPYPFFHSSFFPNMYRPYIRKYNPLIKKYSDASKKNLSASKNINNSCNCAKKIEKSEDKNRLSYDKAVFEILGVPLYIDDLIILGLLFFLYFEEVQDQELFAILILLFFS